MSKMLGKKPVKDPALLAHNLFSKGEYLDMWVYLSEHETIRDLSDESEAELVWTESNIPYAVYEPASERKMDIIYHPSEAVKHNGSLYAHIMFARAGFSADPQDPTFQRTSMFWKSHSLIAYHPRPKEDKRKKLLSASSTNQTEAQEPAGAAYVGVKATSSKSGSIEDDGDNPAAAQEWISYWTPNLTIVLVDEFTTYDREMAPEPMRSSLMFDMESGNYFPLLDVNDFWLLKDKLVPVNETVEELQLSMRVKTLSLLMWQLYISMERSFEIQKAYGTLEGETDKLKRVFLEGNPVLLGITAVVSLLHSIFNFLSFKNDIQFWNQNKSMEGLSARSVVLNFVCQVIVFFYLMDNDTSWLILISSGISCAIEFWKIGKAMKIEVHQWNGIPYLRFKDRDSYSKNKTKEYDEIASRYLSYALYPLVFGYAVYSLMYERHKSWYSWVLSTLTGCVYTFGFIMMCPQLFINYKLKSVAHLPWRQMTYRFLNTIIDDLFAFVIKMPMLHRLSVFRDDIIFLIYIYQRWVYPVDKQRVNEFGFTGPEAAAAAEGAGAEEKQKLLTDSSSSVNSEGAVAAGGIESEQAKDSADSSGNKEAETTGGLVRRGAKKEGEDKCKQVEEEKKEEKQQGKKKK
eukprot:TRINITY_DN3061_c0_g1_i4.p1 TRINITY_DN3061_c0_g1~~TRINITY_DN3061_c0_g1_i4.p1  ORF type:complete len:659 (-),score=205.23 TRINITY_DN3061_c0_g1_i4:323-2212(-)